VRDFLNFGVSLGKRVRSDLWMRFTGPRRLLLAIPLMLAFTASLVGQPADRASAAVHHTPLHPAADAVGGQPLAVPRPIAVPPIAVPPIAVPGTFLETFDGAPAAPEAYTNPHGWDIFTTGLDTRQSGTAAQRAHHGPTCSAPGFPYTATNSHALHSSNDQVFLCNNHLMTATGLTGYGAIYMVPPAMADFSAGTATISFEMSTLRTASRDWVHFTLMPFSGHNKFAYNNLDQAVPPHNINIELAGTNVLIASERAGNGDLSIDGDGFTTWNMVQAANGVREDAARRDIFQVEISRTHLRVCILGNSAGQTYTYDGRTGFCWIDAELPTPLSTEIWNDRAVFMITHVAYNPEKSCSSEEDQFSIVHNPIGDAQCPPNTWHWDNVRIDPALPFTIINPQQRSASFNDPSGANTITFATPAPANSYLSYIAAGECSGQRFSVTGGASWIAAIPQPTTTQCAHPENGGEYWTPIPEGTTSVKFTGQRSFGVWQAGAATIWVAGVGTLPPPSTQPPPVASPPAPPPPAGQPSGPVSAIHQPPAGQVPFDTGFRSSWVDQGEYPTLPPGATASVRIRFRNTGTQVWQRGVPDRQVNLGIAGDTTTFSDLGMAVGWLSPNRPATTEEPAVAPGQTGTFVFTVRAPMTAGSYRLPLRLVVDGIAWLEEQGVFVIVTSDPGHHSAWVDQSSWPVLGAGEVATITFTFRNTGTTTWWRGGSDQINLGVMDDNNTWGTLGIGWPSANRPAAQTEPAVGPGALVTFTFQVRAPSDAGNHALAVRPVVDGVTWLEDDGVFVLITVLP
jgi:hypothetical protein